MFEIVGKQIMVTRGSQCTITLKVNPKEITEDTVFKVGDKVSFAVYEQKKLNQPPLLYKIIEINNDSNVVDIPLTSDDTKIGEMVNKPIKYWYEIELNDKITLVGYDNNGPKIFVLYPEGVKNNV